MQRTPPQDRCSRIVMGFLIYAITYLTIFVFIPFLSHLF